MVDDTKGTTSKSRMIIVAIITLVIGGIAGYFIGVNMTENKNQEELQQKVTTLQQELDQAKAGASDELQEGQEAVTEGQQTLESLQSENATLKSTIAEQSEKIDDLEKQLAETQSSNAPTN